MSKIYKRATLLVSKGPKKKDEHNRTRNVILNFRVTPEEKEQIEARIALSGLTKADYFIQKKKRMKRSNVPPLQTGGLSEMVMYHLINTITAGARMVSDRRDAERSRLMNTDKYDDEYLRSVQEGLEKMLEELLKEEK